jgi:hypothetical protein
VLRLDGAFRNEKVMRLLNATPPFYSADLAGWGEDVLRAVAGKQGAARQVEEHGETRQ